MDIFYYSVFFFRFRIFSLISPASITVLINREPGFCTRRCPAFFIIRSFRRSTIAARVKTNGGRQADMSFVLEALIAVIPIPDSEQAHHCFFCHKLQNRSPPQRSHHIDQKGRSAEGQRKPKYQLWRCFRRAEAMAPSEIPG